MNESALNRAMEKTRELMQAPSCCQQAKDAAQRWLDAVGTERQEAETRAYMAELEADRMPIGTLIAFAQSAQGAQVFGAEQAKAVAEHARQIQAEGAQFCDCAACAAASAILEMQEALL